MRHVVPILLFLAIFRPAPAQADERGLVGGLAEPPLAIEYEAQTWHVEGKPLQRQLDRPVPLPEVVPALAQVEVAQAAPAPPPQPSGGPSGEEEEFFTLDELKGEMKKLAWTKGDFKIVPYGSIWADMMYQTTRTNPGAFTLFVPSAALDDEDAFIIDARRSRIGLDVEGPPIPFFHNAKSSGRVEIDFHGNFINENQPGIQLRHAYWQVKNEQFGFLVGQTWDVISPLYPGTLNYSVGWDGGNIGFRRTQFRLERYLTFSPVFLLMLQGSLNQDIATDFPTTPGIEREPANWPLIEARVAATLGPRGKDARPITWGFSGHIGQTGFDFTAPGPPPLSLPPEDDARFLTWSFNTDLEVPITSRLRLQGEFFHGQNLSPFFGGIGQGVCPCERVGIRSTGGWLDLRYEWTSQLRSYAGFGIDDPHDDDLLLGRTYNQFIFGNIVFDLTPKLTMGFELSFWKTLYQETRVGQIPDALLTPSEPGDSLVYQWMVQYSF